MAPLFMVFMYLISIIVKVNIFQNQASNAGTTGKILLIVIPAMIYIILLMKAVKYAKKGGGQVGGVAIAGAKLLGGLALGGGALLGAAAGRSTLGSVSKYVQNDNARKKDATTFGDYKNWSTLKKFNPLAYVSQAGKTAAAGAAMGIHKIPAGGGKTLGTRMKDVDEGYGHKTHASHILDAKAASEFGKDSKFKDLTEQEQIIVKGEVDKDEMAKFKYGKLFKDLEAPQAAEIQAMHKGTDYIDSNGVQVVAAVARGHEARPISDSHGKTIGIQDQSLALGAGEKIKSDYFVDISRTNMAMGEFVQALRKGSYDIRNLPDMSAKSKGLGPKFAVGLIATVAAGMRLGIKKGVGVEHYGTPQKDFWKDIGNTISDSLKNAKITVNTGGGDHGHGGGDSHAKEVKSVGH